MSGDKHNTIDPRRLRHLARKKPIESLGSAVLSRIAGIAGRRAHQRARRHNLPVTVFVDGHLWVVHPDGSRTRFNPSDTPVANEADA